MYGQNGTVLTAEEVERTSADGFNNEREKGGWEMTPPKGGISLHSIMIGRREIVFMKMFSSVQFFFVLEWQETQYRP